MNTYTLSQRSQNNLNDVHQDLVRVVYLALTFSEYDLSLLKVCVH